MVTVNSYDVQSQSHLYRALKMGIGFPRFYYGTEVHKIGYPNWDRFSQVFLWNRSLEECACHHVFGCLIKRGMVMGNRHGH